MSLTRTVPAAVPSLFHSSMPCVPSLAAKNSVAVDVRSSCWESQEPCAARVDVLDQDGAGGGAVALPQLRAVSAVVGREEQRAVHVRQVSWGTSCRCRIDVLDQDGAGGGAVALPQLVPCVAVVGREEQRAVHVRQVSRGTSRSLPGLMSLTRTVPAAVPSLFHSSLPCVPSSAVKNSVPLTFVR